MDPHHLSCLNSHGLSGFCVTRIPQRGWLMAERTTSPIVRPAMKPTDPRIVRAFLWANSACTRFLPQSHPVMRAQIRQVPRGGRCAGRASSTGPSQTNPGAHAGEGFGMVYAEGSACGLPCVASNEGGVPEVVEHGVTGMLIDPTDNEQVVSNVVALLKDPERAAAIGEAAHRSCVQAPGPAAHAPSRATYTPRSVRSQRIAAARSATRPVLLPSQKASTRWRAPGRRPGIGERPEGGRVAGLRENGSGGARPCSSERGERFIDAASVSQHEPQARFSSGVLSGLWRGGECKNSSPKLQ